MKDWGFGNTERKAGGIQKGSGMLGVDAARLCESQCRVANHILQRGALRVLRKMWIGDLEGWDLGSWLHIEIDVVSNVAGPTC
jgi:hypothetical protein